jgi:hypothetical protein
MWLWSYLSQSIKRSIGHEQDSDPISHKKYLSELMSNGIRLVVIITFVLYCYQIFDHMIYYNYMLNPWAVIYYNYWYMLFTSAFVFETLLQLIIGLMLFIPEWHEHIRQWGLIITVLDFVMKNFFINLAFIQIELIFNHDASAYFVWGNSGFWSITIVYIYMRLIEQPTGYTTCIFPSKNIRNKLYLPLVFVVNSLIFGGIRVVDIFSLM